MSTFVAGRVVGNVRSSTFADITQAEVLVITADGIEFDGDLDAPMQAAIFDRMTCGNLAGKRADVLDGPTLENVAALVVALANHVLGDTE